jgi:hypothetical protein
MSRPLKALKALLLMLARRSRRFLRLALEKPLTLSLVPPPRRLLEHRGGSFPPFILGPIARKPSQTTTEGI